MTDRRIFQNEEYAEELSQTLRGSQHRVLIVSAYLRSETLEWLCTKIPGNVEVNIVTRWQLGELVSGASDLAGFEVGRRQRWGFYLDQNLHAKSVLVDRDTLFLGSANLTSRGIHLFGCGNNELNIKIQPTNDEVKRISRYLDKSYRLTSPMYKEMKAHVECQLANKKIGERGWPKIIQSCMMPAVDSLWIEECFYSSPVEYFSGAKNANVEHDRALFVDIDEGGVFLRSSKILKWLDNVLENCEMPYATFGYITKKLHDSILTNPKPYRREIKSFVKNVFDWVSQYHLYEVIRINHTSAIQAFHSRLDSIASDN